MKGAQADKRFEEPFDWACYGPDEFDYDPVDDPERGIAGYVWYIEDDPLYWD